MTTTNSTNDLLNYLMRTYDLRTDVAMSKFLGVPAPVISNWRAGRLSFGPAYIIRLHEKTAMPVALIKSMLPVSGAK